MSAATFTPDYLIRLALDEHSSATTRVVLLSAERAGVDGVAEFERDELLALVNTEDRQKPLGHNALRGVIRNAINARHLMPGSTSKRIRLPLDGVRPSGDGLRILHELSNGRAVARCFDCSHQATFATAYLTSDAARCPKCKTLTTKAA